MNSSSMGEIPLLSDFLKEGENIETAFYRLIEDIQDGEFFELQFDVLIDSHGDIISEDAPLIQTMKDKSSKELTVSLYKNMDISIFKKIIEIKQSLHRLISISSNGSSLPENITLQSRIDFFQSIKQFLISNQKQISRSDKQDIVTLYSFCLQNFIQQDTLKLSRDVGIETDTKGILYQALSQEKKL